MAQVQTVISNQERVVEIQLPGKTNGNGSITLGRVVRLKPGVNFVPVKDWETAKKNAVVLALIEEVIAQPPSSMAMGGASVERVGRPKLEVGEVVNDEHPLADLDVQGAIDMVRESLDVNEIKLWQKSEGRSDVRKAMDVQLRQLEPPKDGQSIVPTKHSKANKGKAQQQ